MQYFQAQEAGRLRVRWAQFCPDLTAGGVLQHSLPVFFWGHTCVLLKNLAEIPGIVVASHVADFHDLSVRVFQQLFYHTAELVKSLAKYLRLHGWEQQVLFHIHDEPDIHYKKQEDLESRRREYYLAASILRKYLPEVSAIEAVERAVFYGGVDIWVPGTAGYEAGKEEFDRLIRLGERVWTYVCCSPEGWWLNRFLDSPLIRGRLLFWGCAKNRIQGFLHWGFNQFPGGMDPLKGTSCPNDTGIGTDFPCGDSFLVYPGARGPEIGMRLEAQRRGAEDAALWGLLREKNELLHDKLLGEVFVNNYTYCQDPAKLEEVYERLLQELESCCG